MKMAFTTPSNNTPDLPMTHDVLTTNETTLNRVISGEEMERIVAICIIMACTLIGNMVLILSLLCRRSKRVRRVNVFLINLAFGDLAVAMFVNSTEILFHAFGDWVLGPVMCKVIVYVQMVCLASATNLLTAMSLDRYQVIVKPMEALRKRPRILMKIAVAWALSLVFPIPQLFIFIQYDHGLKPDGTLKRMCGSRGYTAPWQRKVYFTFTTTYILIIPMAIMVYCYMKIIHVVWVRASMTALQFKSGQRQHQTRQNSRRSQDTHQPNASSMAAKPTRSLASASHSNATRLGSTNTTRGAREGDRTRDLLNARRFSGRSGQIHVKWVTNESNNGMNGPNLTDFSRQRNNENSKPENSSLTSGKVTRNGGKRRGSSRVSVPRNLMASKRRALIMTLTVVVSFLVCLTPYYFLTLIRIYSDYQIKMETAKMISEFMVMIHSTLNPLLYGLFSLRKRHLKYLVSMVLCFKKNKSVEETRESKEMQRFSKKKGKPRRRDGDKEIIPSLRCFTKELGDSPESVSTSTYYATSSLSASSKSSKCEPSTNHHTKEDSRILAFSDDSIPRLRSDDAAAECSISNGLAEENATHVLANRSLAGKKHSEDHYIHENSYSHFDDTSPCAAQVEMCSNMKICKDVTKCVRNKIVTDGMCIDNSVSDTTARLLI